MDNKLLLKLASMMLDMAQDEFSNHGCNDLPDEVCQLITHEIMDDMRSWNTRGRNDDEWPQRANSIGDTLLMDYLSIKLDEISKEIDRDTKLSSILPNTYTKEDLKKAFDAGRKQHSRMVWGDEYIEEFTYESFKDWNKKK